MSDFVRPIPMTSPTNGAPVQPRIIERDYGDRIVVEAHWIDPNSGILFNKGVIEIREKKTLNENAEGTGTSCIVCGDEDAPNIVEGYHVCDECSKEDVSNCCGAPFAEPGYPDNDICSRCGEHATSDLDYALYDLGVHRSRR